MTDLHTHILPGMDDGAPDLETALTLLRMEAEQGVQAVGLTPHFYRSREHLDAFLQRRKEAYADLSEAVAGEPGLPRLILGAEVAYAPGMTDWEGLEQLCYAGTKILLVELPILPWNDELFRQLYRLEGRLGITPMIAHLDRYFGCQDKKTMKKLLEMELPLQVSAESLLHMFGRKQALQLLENYGGLLISDCHNTDTRPPNVGKALAVAEKKLGRTMAAEIAVAADEALID